MLFQASFEQDIGVMSNDIWLAFSVQWHNCPGAHILDLVRTEQDTLAKEVSKDVIRADELHSPIESVKYVSFLRDKLIIREWHADILEKLLDAWIGPVSYTHLTLPTKA